MELNFTEYDNYTDNNLENDYTKYWEQPKTEKKKKVSFNDILTNMNLVVVEEQPQYLPQPQQQYNIKKQDQYLPQQQEQYNIKKIEQNQAPIDPSVKHSFIYNKYFKDYVDVYKPEPEVLVPKSMEEYRQMVYEQKVKEAEERKRIAEIKSTKLMFTTNKGYENANNGKNPANIRPSKNNLRMMNFR